MEKDARDAHVLTRVSQQCAPQDPPSPWGAARAQVHHAAHAQPTPVFRRVPLLCARARIGNASPCAPAAASAKVAPCDLHNRNPRKPHARPCPCPRPRPCTSGVPSLLRIIWFFPPRLQPYVRVGPRGAGEPGCTATFGPAAFLRLAAAAAARGPTRRARRGGARTGERGARRAAREAQRMACGAAHGRARRALLALSHQSVKMRALGATGAAATLPRPCALG